MKADSNSLIPMIEDLPEDYFKQFEAEEENKSSDSDSSDEESDEHGVDGAGKKKNNVQIVTSPFPDMYWGSEYVEVKSVSPTIMWSKSQ